MKKHLFNAIVILVAASGTALATGQLIPSTGTSIGSQGFKPSNNVSIYVASLTGTSLDPGGFSVVSFHASGNRNFATNSAEPKIFWQDKGTTALGASDVSVTNSTTFTPAVSGWNSL
jgi:hypothetical protein